MTIKLEVTSGPMAGRVFELAGHDTFLFGRGAAARLRLPDDPYLSRNHFLLEANPPHLTLRDLGSLNGVCVNGVQYAGRPGGRMGEGRNAQVNELGLKDGDVIVVGQTTVAVSIGCGDVPQFRVRRPEELKPDGASGATVVSFADSEGVTEIKSPPSAPPPQAALSFLSPSPGNAAGGAGVFGGGGGASRREVVGPDIPGYRLSRVLGRGGMGIVYLAVEEVSGREVAIKLMQADSAAGGVKDFEREIGLTEALRHTNIVSFLGHGAVGGGIYLVLEFVPGNSLDKLQQARGGRLSFAEAAPIFVGSLKGLAHAHDMGYVHRDLKPPNILLGGTDGAWVPKISDFGLAKNYQLAGLSGMTLTGTAGGTHGFMPPEQIIRFKYVMPTSDVFSMGATMFYVLTGKFIYRFTRGVDPIQTILNNDIHAIGDFVPGVSPETAGFFDRATSPDVERRFDSASEMLAAFERIC